MNEAQFTEVYMNNQKSPEEALFTIELGASLRHEENILDEEITIELIKSTRDKTLVWKNCEIDM